MNTDFTEGNKGNEAADEDVRRGRKQFAQAAETLRDSNTDEHGFEQEVTEATEKTRAALLGRLKICAGCEHFEN